MTSTSAELQFCLHKLLAPLRQACQWSELLDDDLAGQGLALALEEKVKPQENLEFKVDKVDF